MFSFKHLLSSTVLQSNFILLLHILFPVNQRKCINLELNKMYAWEMIEKLMDQTSLVPPTIYEFGQEYVSEGTSYHAGGHKYISGID